MTPEENNFLSTLYRIVPVGDGAVMWAPAGELEWHLRYGNPERVRYQAAGVIDSTSYLFGPHISTREAIRRLRIIRNAVESGSQEPHSLPQG